MIAADRPVRRGRGVAALFTAAILVSSFLLFLVQPMVARMALPRLGGAPAVWNSAMVVYQLLLLAGYGYAHALSRWGARTQGTIHLAVLLGASWWLPVGIAAVDLPPAAAPAWWVPWLFALSIGPLFFAMAAQAPLLQRWYAAASGGADPYPLYAASNLGSLAGLAAYPLVVEPLLPLQRQSVLWSIGYALAALLVAGAVLAVPRRAADGAERVPPRPAPRKAVLRWVALAAVPSGLMLAASTYLTTDVVAMPLLWVLPLGLYLVSWIVAFAANRAAADFLTRIAPVTVLLFGGVMIAGYQEQPWASAAMALTVLFMAATALHTALFRDRPPADALTGFYLATALGGSIGGIAAGLVAPVVFDWTYELPLLILAAGALVPQQHLTPWLRDMWAGAGSRRIAFAILFAAIGILFALRRWGPPTLFGEDHRGPAFVTLALLGIAAMGTRRAYVAVLATALLLFGGLRALTMTFGGDDRTRSYFGVYTIADLPGRRQLTHGTTIHGIQLTGSPARERMPTTYYAPGSGVGRAMLAAPRLFGPAARIGVVGLGTGTLACYARPGQRWRFYEIDPEVVRIARDGGRFSFLRRCTPDAVIATGDARLTLERQGDATLDLLALDAFSSDVIPVHLMTAEAFATYARVVAPRGLLLVHVSNRFLELEPVIAGDVRGRGWHAAVRDYNPGAPDRANAAATGSAWVALSRDPEVLRTLAADGGWRPIVPPRRGGGWTDDYSSILPYIK